MKPLKSSAPPSSLLNPAFRYVPAARTDVRKTWAKARKAMERKLITYQPREQP